MWLKITTDSDLVSQPSGYINSTRCLSAHVRPITGVSEPYWVLAIDNTVLDGPHYATEGEAVVALDALIPTL